MSYKEIELTNRDYFLLGTLAERNGREGRFLHRYNDDEVERLVLGGYLEWEMSPVPDGTQAKHYSLTRKGQAAWRAYRFISS